MQQHATIRRPFALALVFALVASAFALAGAPDANADEFIAGKARPQVEIKTWPATIQPAFPASAAVYTVVVEVSDADGVEDIERVELCIYDYVGGASEACAFDDADPRSTVQFVWDARDVVAPDPAFGPDDTGNLGFYVEQLGSRYALGEDDTANDGDDDRPVWTTTGGTTPGLLTLTFTFRASNAMLAGNEWTIRATAFDTEDKSAVDYVGFFERFDLCEGVDPVGTTLDDNCASSGTLTVNYWGEVITERQEILFGEVDEGTEEEVLERSLGEFVANDVSFTSLTAADFQYAPGGPGSPFVLSLVQEFPGSGQVSLRCSPADTVETPGAIFLATTPVEFEASVFSSVNYGPFGPVGDLRSIENRGTGENALALIHSCALAYGGGAAVSSQTYAATVTVGIGQFGTFGD